MKLMRKWAVIGLIAALLLVWTAQKPTAQSGPRRRVLYINSYHRGYKFSDDITRGLETVLKEPANNVELLIEYMDTKRLDSAAYLEELYGLYKTKYGARPPNLVVSSDDAALNFLFKYADDLFPGAPVVFCGANFFDVSRLAGFERFTGVSELIDVAGTLDIALKLHPQTRQIVVVNDITVTGQRIHERIAQLEGNYPNLTFVYLENVSMAELRQRLSQLEPGSLVLLTLFFRDGEGAFFEYDDFTLAVTQSSAVPVYATWDFSLGFGIVGGQLTSGITEGQRAGQVAVRVLNGERPQDIPVVQEPAARPMFDYEQLKRWNIPESALPQDSFILNKPFSFFEEYAQLVWIVGMSFGILVIVVVVLIFNVLRRRQAEAELTRSLDELQVIRVSLEERVQARTQALQQRAALLQTAAEVSQATTEIMDVDVLLVQVVELVRQRFDLYYVGLFLVDAAGKQAVLRAGTGTAGRQMMAQNWQLEVGGQSMIGRCVASGQADIQLDVGEAAVRFENPYLPETRSEMALPLRARGQVIGAITVQSSRMAAFDQDDIRIMQTMTDQVATAISNARLFQQAQQSLDAERRAYGELTREAWQQLLLSSPNLNFMSDREQVQPAGEVWRPEMDMALRTGEVAPGEDGSTLALPIKVRGQVVGVIDGRKPDGGEWSAAEIDLLRAMTEQLNVALEGAQLYRDSQRRAARERLVGEVTGQIRRSLDMETMLRTAANEMRQVLGLERLVVRLGAPVQDGGDA